MKFALKAGSESVVKETWPRSASTSRWSRQIENYSWPRAVSFIMLIQAVRDSWSQPSARHIRALVMSAVSVGHVGD